MSTPAFTPLVLRSGVAIDDPLSTVLEFVRHNSSYRSYDLAPVQQDALLTEVDTSGSETR